MVELQDCQYCETTQYIEIQALINRGPFTLFIIVCKRCEEFTPVKVGHGTDEQRQDDCIKAWNEFNVKGED